MMKIKQSIIISFQFLLSLYGQELCPPLNLNGTSLSGSMRLSWQDIYSEEGNNNIFLECFPDCGIPESVYIEHDIDNGSGGWFRNPDGDPICWYGPDCNLSSSTEAGFSAAAGWSSPNTPVDSRMIIGPFDFPESSTTYLEFYQAYMDGDYQVVQNTIEISVDQGDTWLEVEVSNGNVIGENWTQTLVNLSDYNGQSVHISFRYQCSSGSAEAWFVDHIGLFVNENDDRNELTTSFNEGTYENMFLKSLNVIDRDYISKKSNLKRMKLGNYKPNLFIPLEMRKFVSNLEFTDPVRNCSDPDNESEVNIQVSSGNWPSEISWTLTDSTGTEILSGTAPFDSTLCIPNGLYTINAFDSYGDGWNGAEMVISNSTGDLNFLSYSLVTGAEGSEVFYLGPRYGCMDSFADNYDPLANIDDGSCSYTSCDDDLVFLYCSPGFWPSEISWLIEDMSGELITTGVADEPQDICVPNGTYKVIGFDSWGDGWNSAVLTASDTSGNVLLSFTLNSGSIDSALFSSAGISGCTDPLALNFNSEANIDDNSCTYRDCFQNKGFVIYQDNDSIGFTYNSSYIIDNLSTGNGYEFGVAAKYNNGYSSISNIYSVIWGNVFYDPINVELDTSINSQLLSQEFSFNVDQSFGFTTPFYIDSPDRIDIDYSNSDFYASFNADNFTNMFDPSGIFGGLWQIGDQDDASSDWFQFDTTLDTSSFAWINDDAIGAAGGAQSAYLITDQINVDPNHRTFTTFDLYFPQLSGSCSDPGAGINGEGWGEDLFFMISFDFGGTWTIIDSSMSTGVNWVSRMYDITEHLNGQESFIGAFYYTDCNGNWSYGAGIDNFAVHVGDADDRMAINPYAGWIEAGSPMSVSVSVPNNPQSYDDTFLELTAAFETINVPIAFGLTLNIDEKGTLQIPTSYELSQNYPNPFNPSTVIPFRISKNSPVQLSIFNITGEKVATLLNESIPAGLHNVRWNGTSQDGRPMPAGLYFYEFKSNDFRDTGKMLLIK